MPSRLHEALAALSLVAGAELGMKPIGTARNVTSHGEGTYFDAVLRDERHNVWVAIEVKSKGEGIKEKDRGSGVCLVEIDADNFDLSDPTDVIIDRLRDTINDAHMYWYASVKAEQKKRRELYRERRHS